jgi:hypothetical protein
MMPRNYAPDRTNTVRYDMTISVHSAVVAGRVAGAVQSAVSRLPWCSQRGKSEVDSALMQQQGGVELPGGSLFLNHFSCDYNVPVEKLRIFFLLLSTYRDCYSLW